VAPNTAIINPWPVSLLVALVGFYIGDNTQVNEDLSFRIESPFKAILRGMGDIL
jgi:hypothetical protein